MNNKYSKTFKQSLAAIAVSTVLGLTTVHAEDIKGTVAVSGEKTSGIVVKAVNT